MFADHFLRKVDLRNPVLAADAAVSPEDNVIRHLRFYRRQVDYLTNAMYPAILQGAVTVWAAVQNMINRIGGFEPFAAKGVGPPLAILFFGRLL